MEDSPRIKGEETDSKGTTLEPGEDSPKRRSTQDFLDRWRQFSSRSSERSVDDDNEDEDDDEATDSESSVSAASKKRFRRLRKRLQPFLPQTQEVSSSQEDSVSDYSEQPLSDQNTPFSIEDILVSESREIENDSTILESGDSFSETTDSIEGLMNVDIKGEESGPQAEDATAIVPETESIENILQRRDHELGRGDRGAVEYNRTPTVEQTNATDQLRTADTHEHVSSAAPVGGLLAVDLLNYGDAKRRDNKNKAINERQHQEMQKEQKANNRALKNEILMSKKHHNELRREVAIDREDTKTHLRSTSNEVIYNRNAGSDSLKINKKPEYISVTPTSIEKGPVATDSKKVEQPEQRPNESFENTLQRVAVAENGRISSEFQFERRHEVKDTPGDRRDGLRDATGQAFASGDTYTPIARMDTQDGKLLDMSARNSAREAKQPVYKQAAMTGFWGAVAGIVVFIILYMLTSR